jgi:hypothetical protein
MNDAGQHRKGRDAHRCTEENHRFNQRRSFGKERGVMEKEPAERGSQDEGRDHPGD